MRKKYQYNTRSVKGGRPQLPDYEYQIDILYIIYSITYVISSFMAFFHFHSRISAPAFRLEFGSGSSSRTWRGHMTGQKAAVNPASMPSCDFMQKCRISDSELKKSMLSFEILIPCNLSIDFSAEIPQAAENLVPHPQSCQLCKPILSGKSSIEKHPETIKIRLVETVRDH